MKGIDPSATHPANSLTESSATMLRESFRFASIKQMPCCHENYIHFNVIKICTFYFDFCTFIELN